MTDRGLAELAQDLGDAWRRAVTVPAPSTLQPSLTTEDAYAIQDLIIRKRIEEGRRIAGWKLGLTSSPPPVTPIVGTLLDDMVIPSGSELSLSTMVGPMVEAEVVVQIGELLEDPRSAVELAEGPHEIGPGMEVIDYRTTNSAGSIDWIADNSTVAYAVVGDLAPVADLDPAQIESSLSQDGRHLASGRGDLVMGNPLEAVAWLSRHLVERGRPLQSGDVVLTGSLTGHHLVPSADVEFTADFGSLGVVAVRFRP